MSRSASESLRRFTEEEQQELQLVSRASSEPQIRHQRAVALLAVAEGSSLSEAARLVGWKSHHPVTKVTRRFNRLGLGSHDPRLVGCELPAACARTAPAHRGDGSALSAELCLARGH